MVESMMHNMALVLFVWVLANQAGVPVPVVPALLAAGALASSGSLSFTMVLASAVGAALSADLVWYGLGRWRGARALTALFRLLRQPPTSVDRIQRVFRTHQLRFVWGARFLPELNPVAAGLAGATRVTLARFLLHATGSALVWAGTLAGAGYLLSGAITGSPVGFGLSSTVLIAVALTAVAVSVLTLRGWRRRDRRADAMDAGTGLARLDRFRSRPGGHVDTGDSRLTNAGTASARNCLSGTATAA